MRRRVSIGQPELAAFFDVLKIFWGKTAARFPLNSVSLPGAVKLSGEIFRVKWRLSRSCRESGDYSFPLNSLTTWVVIISIKCGLKLL